METIAVGESVTKPANAKSSFACESLHKYGDIIYGVDVSW